MGFLIDIGKTILDTAFDVLPIVVILFVFQALVLRKRPPHLKRILIGFVYVLVGLSLFLIGLKEALFPIGKLMAQQLIDPEFLGIGASDEVHWRDYLWVYAFAAAIGFSTTIAEPSLIAVSIKAQTIAAPTVGRKHEWRVSQQIAGGHGRFSTIAFFLHGPRIVFG